MDNEKIEHSPLPWGLVLDDECDDLMRIVQVDGYGDVLRLIAKMPRDQDWPLSCANARFIVAAANSHSRLLAEREALLEALRFCMDLAREELVFAKVGTGAKVALRHIERRARAAISATEEGKEK